MWKLIWATTVVLLFAWPMANWLGRLLFGEASGWRVGTGLVGGLWLVTVADLVRRRVRGEPLEPDGDE
jgi:hypothetical protein